MRATDLFEFDDKASDRPSNFVKAGVTRCTETGKLHGFEEFCRRLELESQTFAPQREEAKSF